MMRLMFAIKAHWHAWRAYRLMRRASRLLDAAEAHAAESLINRAIAQRASHERG